MKIRGVWETRKAWIGEQELSPEKSQKLYNHSPDGYNWGYCGSGPAQLALALLLEYSPTVDFAVHHHQAFKFDVIAPLLQNKDFEFDDEVIKEWVKKKLHTG